MRLILAACLCLALGCAGESFKSEADELEYLTTIAQPSVKQFHRRKELEAKAAAVKVESQAHADREQETERLAALERYRQQEQAAAERKAVNDAAKAKAALVEAEEFANRFTPGAPQAALHFKKLVADYPDSPEAKTAQARIEELESERERLKD